MYRLCDDYVKPEFERVPGVAASNVYGGREREMQVIVDPARLAARPTPRSCWSPAVTSEVS